MFTRNQPLGALPVGARFRFPEEPRSQGFPYVILPTLATYRGDRHFPENERPVVIHRQDGRYPRHDKIAGFYPVQNDAGQVVAFVARPSTPVTVPRPWAKALLGGLLLLMVLLAIALAASYWGLIRLGAA
jgi:hypothetical protein